MGADTEWMCVDFCGFLMEKEKYLRVKYSMNPLFKKSPTQFLKYPLTNAALLSFYVVAENLDVPGSLLSWFLCLFLSSHL